MISLGDIHRAAYQLLKAHGEYASEYVHDSAIDCLALNDLKDICIGSGYSMF